MVGICDQCGEEFHNVLNHKLHSDCETPEGYTTSTEKVESLLSNTEWDGNEERVVYVVSGTVDGGTLYYVGRTIQKLEERLKQHTLDCDSSVQFEIESVERVVSVSEDEDINVEEGKTALQVAIDNNTTDVFGPSLLAGDRVPTDDCGDQSTSTAKGDESMSPIMAMREMND